MFALILQPAKSQCHPLKSGLTVATSVTCLIPTLVLSSESRNHRKQESQLPGGDFFSPATVRRRTSYPHSCTLSCHKLSSLIQPDFLLAGRQTRLSPCISSPVTPPRRPNGFIKGSVMTRGLISPVTSVDSASMCC